MVIHTFLDKSNTIISDSDINVGLNPIFEIFYGQDYSRSLFQFDLDKIKGLVCDGTYPDICKLQHTLNFTNCGSLNGKDKYEQFRGMDRATSFELIIFPIPASWDGGKGYDYQKDIWIDGQPKLSNQGSNWFCRKTGVQWGASTNLEYHHNEPHTSPTEYVTFDGVTSGIYTIEYLSKEYDKFKNGQPSIILRTIPFNVGNENISIDFTDVINNMLSNEVAYPNNGFCMCFAPYLEASQVEPKQYVGFFSGHTNSFFEPYLETTYSDVIRDDRGDFYLDKQNRLYFYSNIGGQPTQLLRNPKCKITGSYENGDDFCMTVPVKNGGKGIYYAEFLLPSYESEGKEIEPNRMFYDEWSDIQYFNAKTKSGVNLKPLTLDFTTKSPDDFYLMGSGDFLPKQYVPTIYGINYGEKIVKEEQVRKIFVECRIPYTVDQSQLLDDIKYRLYVKQNDNTEIDVIPYQPLNRATTSNYFLLDILSLLPGRYYLDVQTVSNLEVKNHKDLLYFDVVNKVKEIYN